MSLFEWLLLGTSTGNMILLWQIGKLLYRIHFDMTMKDDDAR